MKQSVRSLLVALLVAIVLGCSGPDESGKKKPRMAAADERSNIVFIFTNDQDAATLEKMPYVGGAFQDGATTYPNATFNYPLCCPSRASILRGQYTHNHNVWDNLPPMGGYDRFRNLGHNSSTLPVWLQNAGYRTGAFGQYLNAYHPIDDPKPPGWDKFAYYGRTYDGGPSPEGTYHDETVKDNAVRWIKGAVDQEPFMAWVSFNAPHYPYPYDPAYAGKFANETMPKPPSFDEEDVSDKPGYVSNWPRITDEGRYDRDYRNRLRSLLTVDDAVRRMVGWVEAAGELDNTYFVFWSDNGYMMGQHRLEYKKHPYVESISFPMLVMGPGVQRGVEDPRVVMNQDLAPTFADIANAGTPAFVDGRSMLPILGGSEGWRDVGLIEGPQPANEYSPPSYRGIRDGDYTYVEYSTGEREFYDLAADPYQLENAYPTLDPARQAELSARLEALRACAGDSCRAAELSARPPETPAP